MTENQKLQIEKLRSDGYGYIRIAQTLGISENTVKSFCRRHNLTGQAALEMPKPQATAKAGISCCLCCGVPVEQKHGRKEKKFCSDQCRMRWRNSNLDKVKHWAVYEYICPHCGKQFTVYGNSHRKYCSHECYVAERFGGGQDE